MSYHEATMLQRNAGGSQPSATEAQHLQAFGGWRTEASAFAVLEAVAVPEEEENDTQM